MTRPSRRIRDLALTAPIAGGLALAPPIITLFNGPADTVTVPGAVIYVFSVWAALVGVALVLSHKLSPEEPRQDKTRFSTDNGHDP